jgi:hypothetical protein
LYFIGQKMSVTLAPGKQQIVINSIIPRQPGNTGSRLMKWFTEFGHLNRGDMLTSEQHRCHNEKEISAQSLNANPLNWSLTRTTPWQMQPALWMSAFPQ